MSGAAALFELKRNHRSDGSVPPEALTPETLMASSTEAVSLLVVTAYAALGLQSKSVHPDLPPTSDAGSAK
jgi:hypothetical protein